MALLKLSPLELRRPRPRTERCRRRVLAMMAPSRICCERHLGVRVGRNQRRASCVGLWQYDCGATRLRSCDMFVSKVGGEGFQKLAMCCGGTREWPTTSVEVSVQGWIKGFLGVRATPPVVNPCPRTCRRPFLDWSNKSDTVESGRRK